MESIYNFDQNISNKKIFNLLNDFSVSEEKYKNKNIRELKADGHNPDVRRQDKYYGEGYHSMLIFPEFLLQNLYLMLNSDEREKVNVNDFFDIHKIQETFSNFTETFGLVTLNSTSGLTPSASLKLLSFVIVTAKVYVPASTISSSGPVTS